MLIVEKENYVIDEEIDYEMDEEECLICYIKDPKLKKYTTTCGHTFHQTCLGLSNKFAKNKSFAECPFCRQSYLNIGDEVKVISGKYKGNLSKISKISAKFAFCLIHDQLRQISIFNLELLKN